MSKAEFLRKLRMLYRVGNASDSDSEWRESWTRPEMAGDACCQHIDRMMRAMLERGVLTSEEHQEFYDML